MKNKIKEAIETYQCPGCINGSDITCFTPHEGFGCGNHRSGTMMLSIGKIFLGLPKGFTRLGFYDAMIPRIYEALEKDHYNQWNVPVWKHLNEEGYTLVRGICPRTNWPFIDIILENCIDKIDCLEISNEDIKNMD